MKKELIQEKLNAFDIYNIMSNNSILLIYQGEFDQEIVKSVLSMTEKKLAQQNVVESTIKKLFNVMMEGLQNICKHQVKGGDHTANPFFIVGHNEECFNIVTGNMIDNTKIELVRSKLDHINSLTQYELKELYKSARLNSVISSVGGAGLGFIDMARKSGNKLEYRFYSHNTTHSYFILNSIINKK